MNNQTSLVLAWLEGEGERRRRSWPLPRRVGDPAVRGWVLVGACFLAGTITAGLLVCGVVKENAGASAAVHLERACEEDVVRQVEADFGIRHLKLPVGYRGRLLGRELRLATAIRGIRPGETLGIFSATGREREPTAGVRLGDHDVIEGHFSSW